MSSFDEKDWNTVSIPACEKLGRGATGVDKYRGKFTDFDLHSLHHARQQPWDLPLGAPLTSFTASKTLAEKAFWKWIEDNKPSFDGVTVNPPLVSCSRDQRSFHD